jgi:RNA polymerase sigma-70 factor (ECF subfamily)
LSDAELVRRCRRGDQEAYRLLVTRYEERAYWLAHQLVGNAESARDIAQEAFVRVVRNIGRFDTARNFYTWLYQIVTNLSIDHLRRSGRQKPTDFEALGGLPDARPSPGDLSARDDLRRRVAAVLGRLPEKYKAVLVLRDLQGFSCQEIAEIVGCNNATARWRLHRARKLFKGLWLGEKVEEV